MRQSESALPNCILRKVYLLSLSHRLRAYAAPSVPVYVRGIAMVGWITSISVIAIVPIDVWATITAGDTSSIAVMWLICYWCVCFMKSSSTQLCWLLCCVGASLMVSNSESAPGFTKHPVTILLKRKTPGALDLARLGHRTTQALSYFLIPLTQGFADAGEFTFAGRHALRSRDDS